MCQERKVRQSTLDKKITIQKRSQKAYNYLGIAVQTSTETYLDASPAMLGAGFVRENYLEAQLVLNAQTKQ